MYKIITIFSLLALTSYAQAGLFLDLEVGAHVGGWNGNDCEYDYAAYINNTSCQPPSQYLGDGALGRIRAGYQTPKKLIGRIEISGHVYYEHTSELSDSFDTGLDVIMGGIRFE